MTQISENRRRCKRRREWSVPDFLLIVAVSVISFRAFSKGFVPLANSRRNVRVVRCPTSTSPVSESFVETSETDDAGVGGDSSLSSCPFVKRFPRYRVDLSPVPRKGQEGIAAASTFFGGFQSGWNQHQLKQQGFDVMNGMKDLDAFCFLWTKAADLAATNSTPDSQMRLAFPEAQPDLIRNWLDLLEWIQDFEIRERILGTEQRIRGTFSIQSNVPCLELLPPLEPRMHLPTHSFSADAIDNQTRSWVQRVLVDLSICPFTKSKTFSGQGLADVGVPVGRIAYHTSTASSLLPLLRDIWHAIQQMIQVGPKGKSGVSSILLAAPAYNSNFDTWSGPVFGVLEASVVACRMESKVGVVCFHPQYATPDGTTFPGFGHMHSLPRLQQWYRECTQPKKRRPTDLEPPEEVSMLDLSPEQIAAGGAWQRRTPHATINVLRADQLQAAESRRNTPQMYTRNIQALMQLGNDRLQADLEKDQQLGL